MKVLVTGGQGQLAHELACSAPASVEVLQPAKSELDITCASQVARFFDTYEPQVVINTAAYTAVDKAEEQREQAHAVNELGAANLAKQCGEANLYLIHISTDFVFDGSKNTPYLPEESPNPQSVYGASKLAGENAIRDQRLARYAIVRTSWLYGRKGQNFVKTMLRLMRDKPSLNVVADQLGSPTWAHGLAKVCWGLVAKPANGTFHWSDSGIASWYDFAVAIQRLANQHGILQHAIPIHPIPSSQYPTPAKRPHYSALDKESLMQALPQLEAKHWRDQLESMLIESNAELKI